MAQTPPDESSHGLLPKFATVSGGGGGIITHRTRQLSCILENWPESSSESYNLLIPDDDQIPNSMQSSVWVNDDNDTDENNTPDRKNLLSSLKNDSHILEIDDLEESLKYNCYYSEETENKNGDLNEIIGNKVVQYPEVMISSCYGSIDNNGDNGDPMDMLYINSICLNNAPKCRSPLSASLNTSIYGESTVDSMIPDGNECSPLMDFSVKESEILNSENVAHWKILY